MKASHNISPRRIATIILAIIIGSATLSWASAEPANAKDPVAISLNGQTLDVNKDSIDMTVKGFVRMNTLDESGGRVKFKVVIRHKTMVSNFPILTVDERYEDGQEFLEVEIEKVLAKARLGDEILIIPSGASLSTDPLIFQVRIKRGKGC